MQTTPEPHCESLKQKVAAFHKNVNMYKHSHSAGHLRYLRNLLKEHLTAHVLNTFLLWQMLSVL